MIKNRIFLLFFLLGNSIGLYSMMPQSQMPQPELPLELQDIPARLDEAALLAGKSRGTFAQEQLNLIVALQRIVNQEKAYNSNAGLAEGHLADLQKQYLSKNFITLSSGELLDLYKKTEEIKLEVLKIQYTQSLQNAKDATPDKTREVTAIAPWNKNLIWNNDRSHVLMASYMSEWAMNNFYKPALGKEYTTSPNKAYMSWVTAAPELRNFIAQYLSDPNPYKLPLFDRINQLLGLPPMPHAQKYVVELWVKPEDIMRPCVDNEIIDSICIPDPDPETLPTEYKDLFKFANSDEEYKQWFIDRRNSIYNDPKWPFPWTRLGYTYDIGSPQAVKKGLSEFTIKPSSTLIVKDIYRVEAYH